MIKKELQYKITLEWIEKFEEALRNIDKNYPDIDPILRRAYKDSMESQLQDLRQEAAKYRKELGIEEK